MNEKMTIEETINGLQSMIQSKKFIEHDFDGGVDEDVCERAIELLKEQEVVVRCKDCKHIFNGCCYNRKSERINFGVYVAEDWFCADGERR